MEFSTAEEEEWSKWGVCVDAKVECLYVVCVYRVEEEDCLEVVAGCEGWYHPICLPYINNTFRVAPIFPSP